MSRAYDKAAKAAYEASDKAHSRDIGELHNLAASHHRIAELAKNQLRLLINELCSRFKNYTKAEFLPVKHPMMIRAQDNKVLNVVVTAICPRLNMGNVAGGFAPAAQHALVTHNALSMLLDRIKALCILARRNALHALLQERAVPYTSTYSRAIFSSSPCARIILKRLSANGAGSLYTLMFGFRRSSSLRGIGASNTAKLCVSKRPPSACYRLTALFAVLVCRMSEKCRAAFLVAENSLLHIAGAFFEWLTAVLTELLHKHSYNTQKV